MKVAAIVPAAGKGRRLGSRLPKSFVKLAGEPMLVHTLRRLAAAYPFLEFVVPVDRADRSKVRTLLKSRGIAAKVVTGGATRAESVRNALSAVSRDCGWVLVHDAARPLVTPQVIRHTLRAAQRSGAALAAWPVSSTVKRSDARGLWVRHTVDRDTLYLAQTPQVFRKTLLERRYRSLGRQALSSTDEAALFDGSKTRVRLALGDGNNIKITTPEDLKLAHVILAT